MSRRTEAASWLVLAVAIATGCARPHAANVRDVDVGHHHVRFALPAGWEHLDHGREQLLRLEEAQLTLVDLGPVTAAAMARELEAARTLWRDGRRLDAIQRVHELRSPVLKYASREQRLAFWTPWTNATYVAPGADSAQIGPAFDALIRGTQAFEAPAPDVLYQYVAELVLNARGREIAARERETIHGMHWYVYDTWDRLTHGYRTRVAFGLDEGVLLALTMDRGVTERLTPAFDEVLASLEVAPAKRQRAAGE